MILIKDYAEPFYFFFKLFFQTCLYNSFLIAVEGTLNLVHTI